MIDIFEIRNHLNKVLYLFKITFTLLRYHTNITYHIFQKNGSLAEMTTRCHSLSLVVICCTTSDNELHYVPPDSLFTNDLYFLFK